MDLLSNNYFNLTQFISRSSTNRLNLCDPSSGLINEPLFQLANGFILISYLTSTSLVGLLFMRCCLIIGSLCLALWAYINVCSIDSVIWNLLFFIIHAVYVFILLYKLHPFIKFPRDVELVYRDLFQPLNVSRYSFNQLYKSIREIQVLKAHDIYCVEGKTPVDKLSLLLSGRLAILKNGRAIHLIDGHQFIDSPEWFGVGTSDAYQVTIVALEECRLIVWHRDKLKLIISDDIYLKTLMDSVLGRDLVKKLLFVTDTISNNFSVDHQLNENSKLIMPIHRAMDHVVKREIHDLESRKK
ncbi:popeye domain-containing protein 3-like isoform X2 [Panonychus citri]|uniref:popeye domain-containing protein 3-like isoform X2 n=1 Tax=Panonychus citri TaxID=50023 RepID=UPI002306E8BA|nr:popeye domain-containing protein 3-like isoform X2 [Panonychus citri]